MTVVQRNRKYARIFSAISVLLNLGPIAFYSLKAYSVAADKPMGQYILSSVLSVAVILCLASLVLKRLPRCTIWMLLIGLYMCLDGILSCVIVIAATQFADELIVCPIRNRYRSRLIAAEEATKIFEELSGNGSAE